MRGVRYFWGSDVFATYYYLDTSTYNVLTPMMQEPDDTPRLRLPQSKQTCVGRPYQQKNAHSLLLIVEKADKSVPTFAHFIS